MLVFFNGREVKEMLRMVVSRLCQSKAEFLDARVDESVINLKDVEFSPRFSGVGLPVPQQIIGSASYRPMPSRQDFFN